MTLGLTLKGLLEPKVSFLNHVGQFNITIQVEWFHEYRVFVVLYGLNSIQNEFSSYFIFILSKLAFLGQKPSVSHLYKLGGLAYL